MDTFDSFVVFGLVVGMLSLFVLVLVSQIILAFGWWSPLVFGAAFAFGGGVFKLCAYIERLN